MRHEIFLAFLLYGIVVGPWSVWWWGTGVCAIIPANIPGVLLGDWLYDLSVKWLGDPSSPFAHYTIPTPLRIPQIYVLSSILFWAPFGAALQILRDWVFPRFMSPRGLASLMRVIRLAIALTLGLTLNWTLDILLPAPTPSGIS